MELTDFLQTLAASAVAILIPLWTPRLKRYLKRQTAL